MCALRDSQPVFLFVLVFDLASGNSAMATDRLGGGARAWLLLCGRRWEVQVSSGVLVSLPPREPFTFCFRLRVGLARRDLSTWRESSLQRRFQRTRGPAPTTFVLTAVS